MCWEEAGFRDSGQIKEIKFYTQTADGDGSSAAGAQSLYIVKVNTAGSRQPERDLAHGWDLCVPESEFLPPLGIGGESGGVMESRCESSSGVRVRVFTIQLSGKLQQFSGCAAGAG